MLLTGQSAVHPRLKICGRGRTRELDPFRPPDRAVGAGTMIAQLPWASSTVAGSSGSDTLMRVQSAAARLTLRCPGTASYHGVPVTIPKMHLSESARAIAAGDLTARIMFLLGTLAPFRHGMSATQCNRPRSVGAQGQKRIGRNTRRDDHAAHAHEHDRACHGSGLSPA